MVSVYFASALRSAVGGQGNIEVDNFEGTLGTLLTKLSEQVGPSLQERLLENGEVRRFVNVYVDGQDVRFSGGLSTPVPRSSAVDFIPAVAGG